MNKVDSMYEGKGSTIATTDCIIFDAMAVIQMLLGSSKTVNTVDSRYLDFAYLK